VDAVAVSFVETAEEMQQVRKAIQKWTKRSVQLIAKIERPKALKNLEAITESADALMVARGDLAIETEPEMVPLYQRKIINLARKMGKPVIVATQMLQSMVESPVATRAEISDAATAIFESADAFMLSNESAVGTYPVQAVRTLARVARATEQALLKEHPYLEGKVETEDERLALNACVLAHQLNAKGILLVTEAGFTAKTVLKYRPSATVFSFTSSADIAKALNFLWGANEIRLSKETEPETLLQILKKNKEVQSGDKIVFIQLKDKRSQLVILEV
ncbi:MAG: pyruvate kinase, partial [Patescibacteria group bacterium]